MNVFFWTFFGFIWGSLPFSYWIGQAVAKVDLREVNDGNPGASNVFRTCGRAWGSVALVLDWAKGFVPVFLAILVGGLDGWALVPVAVAPVLGHAYSPFLRFRGGKALATSFGIWTALTLVPGPFVLGGLLTIFVIFQSNHGWSVVFAMLVFFVFLLIRGLSGPTFAIWLIDFGLLGWKYRSEILAGPQFHFPKRNTAEGHNG